MKRFSMIIDLVALALSCGQWGEPLSRTVGTTAETVALHRQASPGIEVIPLMQAPPAPAFTFFGEKVSTSLGESAHIACATLLDGVASGHIRQRYASVGIPCGFARIHLQPAFPSHLSGPLNPQNFTH